MTSKISIIVADDHAMVRDGLKRLLESEQNLTVAAQAVSGSDLLEKLPSVECQLLLLDLNMPPPNGPKLVQLVREGWPNLPILVVTMHNEARMAQAALQAGANGFITKDSEPSLLLQAVHRVASGGRYVSPEILEGIAFLPTSAAGVELSAREREVLSRLVAGQSNSEIAHALFISEKTVSTHKTNLMAKVGVNNLAELIRFADSLELR
jgi:DNA-binding NarL/FixJ family response regulator